MTDAVPEDAVAEDKRLAAGAMLAAAREAQNLSIADVARQLRLSIRQIDALEQDNYDRLPGNTFARGFIRNYARLLALDPQPVLAAYQNAHPEPEFKSIATPSPRIRFSTRPGKKWLWYAAAALAILILAPILVYEALHGNTPASRPKLVVPTPPVKTDSATSESVLPAMPASQPSVAQPPDTLASEVGLAAPAVQGETIKLNFDGEAWVEIRDGDGKKILSQRNPAGSEQVVRGKPPFSLVVGNAAKVRMTYNGKPVDLAPYVNVDVARLTLE